MAGGPKPSNSNLLRQRGGTIFAISLLVPLEQLIGAAVIVQFCNTERLPL